MAKGYWSGRVDVHDDEGYKPYAAANLAIFKKFGGRYVVRGGKFTGVEGRADSSLQILAVTVLTSYDDGDLHAAGYRLGVSEMVEARAQQAQVLGVDGLVCSPEEAAALRKVVGHQMCLVTPGIRPAGSASGDQKRIMTPGRAIAAGADYLVVGRPVVEASDPRAVADSIQAEIAQALGA